MLSPNPHCTHGSRGPQSKLPLWDHRDCETIAGPGRWLHISKQQLQSRGFVGKGKWQNVSCSVTAASLQRHCSVTAASLQSVQVLQLLYWQTDHASQWDRDFPQIRPTTMRNRRISMPSNALVGREKIEGPDAGALRDRTSHGLYAYCCRDMDAGRWTVITPLLVCRGQLPKERRPFGLMDSTHTWSPMVSA